MALEVTAQKINRDAEDQPIERIVVREVIEPPLAHSLVLQLCGRWSLRELRTALDQLIPIRNRQMLSEGRPELVLAFHANLERSKGTRDMVRIARKAGVEVKVFAS